MVHSHHRNETRTLQAALLTGGFMIAEAIGGVLSGSLALIADAAHMLTDTASLTLAWLAFRFARRPADASRTYGFGRLQILVAFANGISLFFIIGWIVFEAISRLMSPVEVLGDVMFGVAVAGLAVNVAAFWLLHGADRENLNIRGALLHVAGDLLGSIAALVASLVILATGWTPVDPLLSLLVAMLLARAAWRITVQSGHILLEGTPPDIDVSEIKADLEREIAGVEDVHHIHVWSLTQERPLVTLHARVSVDAMPGEVTRQIKARLADQFGLGHATVEIEQDACADDPHAAKATAGGSPAQATPTRRS